MFKTGCVCQHGGCVKTKSNDQLVEKCKTRSHFFQRPAELVENINTQNPTAGQADPK